MNTDQRLRQAAEQAREAIRPDPPRLRKHRVRASGAFLIGAALVVGFVGAALLVARALGDPDVDSAVGSSTTVLTTATSVSTAPSATSPSTIGTTGNTTATSTTEPTSDPSGPRPHNFLPTVEPAGEGWVRLEAVFADGTSASLRIEEGL